MQECSELGIKGRNIPGELAQLQQQLPGLFQEALTDINSPTITSALDHYAAVTAYAHSPAPDAAPPDPSQAPPADPSRLLPHLHAIRSGTRSQELAVNSSHTGNSTEGEAVSVAGGSQEIQWDMTGEAGDASSATQEPAAAASGGGANIDWDVAIDPGSSGNAGTARCKRQVHFTT